MSESSSDEASSRFLPLIVRSSIVLIKVSVIRSWVCSEPPRIENLSALVILFYDRHRNPILDQTNEPSLWIFVRNGWVVETLRHINKY